MICKLHWPAAGDCPPCRCPWCRAGGRRSWTWSWWRNGGGGNRTGSCGWRCGARGGLWKEVSILFLPKYSIRNHVKKKHDCELYVYTKIDWLSKRLQLVHTSVNDDMVVLSKILYKTNRFLQGNILLGSAIQKTIFREGRSKGKFLLSIGLIGL